MITRKLTTALSLSSHPADNCQSIHPANDVMITITVTDFNSFSQDFYDSVINALPFHRLRCTKCGHSGCLTIHGYYKRSVSSSGGKYVLKICRVFCSECGRTHAILLSSFVPYQQVSADVQRRIANALESGKNPNSVCTPEGSIDENNVKAVIRRYQKHWKERLLSEKISLSEIAHLICSCFSFFSTQFMQIRRGFNQLFSIPT